MTRWIVMGIVMAFAIGFVGCRACMAPYDYCQPTFIPERGDQCMGELYRCGSVLGGMERVSSANGQCESCGGGSTEYYGALPTQSFANVPSQDVSAYPDALPTPPATAAGPYVATKYAQTADNSGAYMNY
ncbi:MAG: hypothetical protein Q4G03_11445 [Planctomycetia bacterium]|nr:hypothetical protein [Planctomycetia bacterium]